MNSIDSINSVDSTESKIQIIFDLSNPFEYIEQFCTINGLKIPIPDPNPSNSPNKYNPNIVLDLLTHDYIIFFTSKYFSWLKRPLMKFFKKCEIVCLNYYDKKLIERSIEQLNFFIKKNQSGQIIDAIKEKYKLRKFKYCCFFENSIEPNILYKKINFANEQLFISFDKYSIKKIEYKLKAFSQIAEKMGADKILIIYDKETSQKILVSANIGSNSPNYIPNAGLGATYTNANDSSEQIKLGFDYSNDLHNFNLNKYDLIDTIQRENAFFLSKEEFNSDIDLNFLIDARCINLIKEYETELVFKHANEWEKKIFAYASKFKLNLDTKSSIKNDVNIKIKISFLNIYKHSSAINGFNLYCFKEGFFHLCNLISLNRTNSESYLKIGNFLSSHLYYLNKGRFTIPLIYNKSLDLIKTHDDILKLNFTQNELASLYEQFFSLNLNYMQFKNFRSIIIKQPENFYDVINRHNYYGVEKKVFFSKLNFPINKLLFISYQYHIITNYKLKLLEKIKSYIYNTYTKMICQKDIFINLKKQMSNSFKTMKKTIKNIIKDPNYSLQIIKQSYVGYESIISNPVKILINPMLHQLTDYIKSRSLIITVSNEQKILTNLFAKLCACAKKYYILVDKTESNNYKYTNIHKYITKYIYYLPEHFLDYETQEELGDMDIDSSSINEYLNSSDVDDNVNDYNYIYYSDEKVDSIQSDTQSNIINGGDLHDQISEFSFEHDSTNIDLVQSIQNVDDLLDLIHKYVCIAKLYLENLEIYKENKIVYNPNDDINVLSNLFKIYKPSLDDYFKDENIEEIIFANILFYNNELKYLELEKILINCFNSSFNLDNGLYEYVCKTTKKYDLFKHRLSIELSNIIVNKSYEEQNSYNVIVQLFIPLIVHELRPNDFEFDLDSKEKTKTSLIKKVNSFILKLLRNCNTKISDSLNLEVFRKSTHENYSKYRVFYTVENLDQIINKSESIQL